MHSWSFSFSIECRETDGKTENESCAFHLLIITAQERWRVKEVREKEYISPEATSVSDLLIIHFTR